MQGERTVAGGGGQQRVDERGGAKGDNGTTMRFEGGTLLGFSDSNTEG